MSKSSRNLQPHRKSGGRNDLRRSENLILKILLSQYTSTPSVSLLLYLERGSCSQSQMQIPGLNLLNGDPPPADVDHDKPPSPSTTGSLLLQTALALAANNVAAPEASQDINRQAEPLGREDFDSAIINKITNAESSIDLVTNATSETILQLADPLDIALAECSEKSSTESDAEDQLHDNDIEGYTSLSGFC